MFGRLRFADCGTSSMMIRVPAQRFILTDLTATTVHSMLDSKEVATKPTILLILLLRISLFCSRTPPCGPDFAKSRGGFLDATQMDPILALLRRYDVNFCVFNTIIIKIHCFLSNLTKNPPNFGRAAPNFDVILDFQRNPGNCRDLARLRRAPRGSQPGWSDLSRVGQISAELVRSQPVRTTGAAGEIRSLSGGVKRRSERIGQPEGWRDLGAKRRDPGSPEAGQFAHGAVSLPQDRRRISPAAEGGVTG